ncbi:hypothetical protein RHGRI_006208 [Rhododendron griersonianum]|uniref:Cation efflux protein cytoplasmic domain-containing protein n=1 Tax=Rhododendron griersonianum TaxID=479676 RepID=A0AAV6KTD0_9ERIC|nr:hypothetical protein RHGRI_006208 [Rhododendron griersonianum]
MDLKSPLLPNDGPKSNRKRNSVASIKRDFFSKLPQKVRSGLDPETPFQIDLSKITGLIEGEKEYYERQLATLKSFEEVDSIDASHVIDEEQDREEQMQHERAMNISNVANVLLLVFKIYATVRSGSLAIAASTLDSLLDLMAGGILWFTHLSMKNINIYKYPIGKLRVQPVGIIIFAAVMATLGSRSHEFPLSVSQPSSCAASWRNSSSARKGIQDRRNQIRLVNVKKAIMLYTLSIDSTDNLSTESDHYFDVVTNLVGLIAAVLGDKFYWWIDPVGAIILAVYTIANWSGTVLENAVSLVGQSAPPEVLQKLTYLVLRHHPQIKRVDTVRAYTFGVLYFVEVDIELPEDLPLKEAHAIGESLQIKIEELAEVERAFVHLDFECDHKPEHSVLSRLPNSQP